MANKNYHFHLFPEDPVSWFFIAACVLFICLAFGE